jgi:hypothetical protein
MTKILITNYYGLIEALMLSGRALQKLGYEVYDYPLFKYARDSNDKLENYEEHMIKYITDNNINIVLWWYAGIEYEKMKYIKEQLNQKIIHIFFNWDEPFNWLACDLANKAKLWDAVFVSCEETLVKYLEHGTKQAFYLLPGYDIECHHPIFVNDDDLDIKEKKYNCDVSICLTNLYEDEIIFCDQFLKRKPFVDNIYNNQTKYNYTFFIYGPEFLKKIYPRSYKGFVDYHNSIYVFNYSKINICTHVICNKNMYLNERCILVAGSGGLLFVDPIKGIEQLFTNNHDCVYIDKTNYLNQIVEILNNYNKYYLVRHNAFQTSKKYNYDKWAEKIHSYLSSNIKPICVN